MDTLLLADDVLIWGTAENGNESTEGCYKGTQTENEYGKDGDHENFK